MIGAGRVIIGGVFMAKPVLSVRVLGVDTATATRLQWLARMTAARDAAIGFGTLARARHPDGVNGWLLAGAACDLVDAIAIADALRRKQVATLPGLTVIAVAAASSVIAVAAASSVIAVAAAAAGTESK